MVIAICPLTAPRAAVVLRRRSLVPHRRLKRNLTMSRAHHDPNLVSVVSNRWLKSKLTDSSTKVLDASWYMPAVGRDPLAEYRKEHIPSAQYFDTNGISDRSTDLPHMLPSETGFAASLDVLGISPSDRVVVYDGMGLFSAARAWWMFRTFGHEHVSVLDGGLPGWKSAGFEIESASNKTDEEILIATEACLNAKKGQTTYPAKLDKSQVRNIDEMLKIIQDQSAQVLDARPADRFFGKAPEPRKGLKSGHMPGSLNIPFNAVLTSDGFLKSKDELLQVVKEAQVDSKKDVVCTCGSGITSCVLALVLEHIGYTNKAQSNTSHSSLESCI